MPHSKDSKKLNSKSNKKSKINSRTKSKSSKSKNKNKNSGSHHGHHHHKHHHHLHHHGQKQSSKGMSVGSKARSNQTTSKASKSRVSQSRGHKFVLKGKMPPSTKDNIVGPSRMLPDQMTTIYTVPDEHFKTEEDVVKFNNYEILEQIGKGGFAVVYKAKNTETGQLCACKTVQVSNQDAVLEMKNELFIMEMVDNPFAIKLYLHFLVNQTLYIFMQLADAGCFGKMLEKDGVLDEDEARYYFAQMCCGVSHMHERNIAHRDIKPANFLMANHPSGKKIVLISDYGLSRVVHQTDSGRKPVMYTTQCGTPAYMAPEILSGNEYNCYLVDIWSLGVTLYATLNLMTPFNVDQEDYGVKSMMEGRWNWTDQVKAAPSDGLNEIMTGMLQADPNKRFTMQKVVVHKWLADEYQKVQKLQSKKSSSKK